ncbi:hypothetical protein [Pseudanabaena sp. Chao 1811]|uniref:hypothetical protein n=1 Tax=Pseudanabaena sp. Chao 1811 TaxID=2963092 RepID=UPI0022F39A71|nr:hypothetical protein [Pseudanabaena sp. Chao 1811]
MSTSDCNPPQINPATQETAQKLFSEISHLIDVAKQRAAIAIIRKELLQAKLQQAIASARRQLPSSEQD